MSKRISFLFCTACILAPSMVFAYGEDESVPADARAMHLLVNEARCDTVTALADCGKNCLGGKDSYDKVITPAYWDTNAFHAAQFHANMHAYVGGQCLQHGSLCKLKSTVASDFPDKCDGDPKCACQGGTASCGESNTKTATFARIGMFTNTASAENIAWNGGNAYEVFFSFLHEDGKQTYGHRANILGAGNKGVGIGRNSRWTVQDFVYKTSETSPITAGFYYKNNKTKDFWFKAHYYGTAEAKKASLSMNGTCSELKLVVGSAKNGVFGASDVATPEKCTPFVFEVMDASGAVSRYPTTGSLLYDCDKKSWANTEIAGCLGGTNVDPEDPGKTDPEDPGKTDPEDPGKTDPEDPGKTDPEDPGNTDPEDSGNTDPEDPGNTDPEEPGKTDSDEPTGPKTEPVDTDDVENHSDSSCSANPMGGTHGVWPWLLLLPLGLVRRRKAE